MAYSWGYGPPHFGVDRLVEVKRSKASVWPLERFGVPPFSWGYGLPRFVWPLELGWRTPRLRCDPLSWG